MLLSCHVAAMAPGTNVGAATPVGLDGAIGSDKAVNDAAASMRAIAEEHGRNADVAASFVTDAVSISAEQALRRRRDRPDRADAPMPCSPRSTATR